MLSYESWDMGAAGRISLDSLLPPLLAADGAVKLPNPSLSACSWNMGATGRFSLDSATDRLSEDMSRLSFEAAARWVQLAAR